MSFLLNFLLNFAKIFRLELSANLKYYFIKYDVILILLFTYIIFFFCNISCKIHAEAKASELLVLQTVYEGIIDNGDGLPYSIKSWELLGLLDKTVPIMVSYAALSWVEKQPIFDSLFPHDIGSREQAAYIAKSVSYLMNDFKLLNAVVHEYYLKFNTLNLTEKRILLNYISAIQRLWLYIDLCERNGVINLEKYMDTIIQKEVMNYRNCRDDFAIQFKLDRHRVDLSFKRNEAIEARLKVPPVGISWKGVLVVSVASLLLLGNLVWVGMMI